jgi:ketosteroid isomerase-like protein
MTGGNLDVVRRIYEAMDRQDAAAVTELVHPDMEWIPDHRVGEGPVRGRESVIRFFSDRAEMFGDITTEVERVWEQGDTVLAFIHVTGEGRARGAPFDLRIAHVWTFRDGAIIRGQGFGDRDEAHAAAGVSE